MCIRDSSERALDLLVDCSCAQHGRTERVHFGIVVRVESAAVSSIHEGAVNHVILVITELVIGGRMSAPSGAEFNRTVFRAWSPTHADDHFEWHDLTEPHWFCTHRGQGIQCAGGWPISPVSYTHLRAHE